MHSDSVSTANASKAPKDFGKKKRVNRTAKLKQCKLDARREQWLSQVRRAGGKEEPNGVAFGTAAKNEGNKVPEKPQIRASGEEGHDGGGGHMHHFSDCESPSNSVMSHGSVLEGIDSGTNFTGSSRSSVSSSRCSSSSRSGGSFSGSMSGEDEDGDDDCLDDWETVADALAATEEKQKPCDHGLDPKSAPVDKKVAFVDSPPDAKMQPVNNANVLGAKPGSGVSSRAPACGRAWRPDDAFRPQSLPNLSKQYSFPTNSERYLGCGGAVWGCKNATVSAPTICPICTEDFDLTDSNFSPCPCGFKLCLFCHKKIEEGDGRCPGCRKPYKKEPVKGEAILDGGSLTYRLARSCSMFTRS